MSRTALAPSILSFEMPDVFSAVAEIESAGAEWLHLDVMDGQFVPPITFGAAYAASLRKRFQIPLEAHLMTLTPENHFEAFATAGCQRIIFHAEATAHSHRLVQTLRSMGVSPGIAINPGTPVEAVIPVLGDVDMVLAMTVNPGWGGQAFLPGVLEKVRRLRDLRPDLWIQVDGGIDPKTLPVAREAGADLFVVGSYLTRVPIAEGIAALRTA